MVRGPDQGKFQGAFAFRSSLGHDLATAGLGRRRGLVRNLSNASRITALVVCAPKAIVGLAERGVDADIGGDSGEDEVSDAAGRA